MVESGDADAAPPSDEELVAALDTADTVGDGARPLIDDAGRVRLSFSRIDVLESCPRRFRYAYVDRLPTPPGPALSFGSSVHAVLEWLHRRPGTTPPDDEELLASLFERWDGAGYADVPRERQLEDYGRAKDTLLRYRDRLRRTGIRPSAGIEAWFELEFEEAVVVGAIDRIEVDEAGALHVIDYKTNQRAKSRRQVAGSLQLAIYALACEHLYGSLPATVALDFVFVGTEVRVPIDELDLDAVPDRVREAARRVRSGDDAPNPNPLCPWCDFRDRCPAWATDERRDPDRPAPDLLGPALRERDRLRRSLVRDAARLRVLDAAVERLRDDLDG